MANSDYYKEEGSVVKPDVPHYTRPEEYDPPQTHGGSLDFEGFADEVNRLLTLAYSEEGITFTHDEPLGNDVDAITPPVITYETFERVRSESHKSLDPILFEKRRDPEFPDSTMKIYRMWFDVETEFKIYATTNRRAIEVMELFETFLFTYKGYFKHKGVSEIVFLAETKPEVKSRWNKELVCRTLRYLVRIERVTTIRSHNLKQVNTIASSGEDHIPLPDEILTPIIENYRKLNRPK